jgi:hypothetical protein
MSVSENFKTFCSNLRMSSTVVSNVQYRYKRITKQLNADFRDLNSDTAYSLYVGSYGRGTAIHVSDIDMIIELPYSVYQQYDGHSGNGQSALLKAVRDSLKKTYSTTHMRGDGQVVQLNFDDGICYEIVPGFINKDNESFTYPDTNGGGSWKVTKPRTEISELKNGDALWNNNLRRLCRMARAWKDQWNVPMGGLLIDTLAYNFMKQWEYRDKSHIYYDWMNCDFFEYLKNQDSEKEYWLAVGSNQYVYRKGSFEYKALRCYNISLEAVEHQSNDKNWSAKQKWREIYGTKYPD